MQRAGGGVLAAIGGEGGEGEGRILNRKAHRINVSKDDDKPLQSAALLTPSCSTEEVSAFACLMDYQYPT